MKCKYMSRGGFIYKSLIPLLQITVLTAAYQKKKICQLMHKRIALKRILKFTLKQLLHVLVQSPSSGSVLFELAKDIVVEIMN